MDDELYEEQRRRRCGGKLEGKSPLASIFVGLVCTTFGGWLLSGWVPDTPCNGFTLNLFVACIECGLIIAGVWEVIKGFKAL